MYLSEMIERARTILDTHDLLGPADREMLEETIQLMREKEVYDFLRRLRLPVTHVEVEPEYEGWDWSSYDLYEGEDE